MTIPVYNGQMSSRERVLCALAKDVPDRVPVDYFSNPGAHGRLCTALGLDPGDGEAFLQAIGADIRGVNPAYAGQALFAPRPDRQVDPVYGHVMRWAQNEDGGYWDFCDFPLQDADEETIRAFPVPSPDDFDYDAAVAQLRRHSKNRLATFIGGSGHGDIINATGRVMGMEDTLVNLQVKDEATLAYIDRRCQMELDVLERLLHLAGDSVDFVWMGEDLGTQRGPMISLELYRQVLRPRHQRYIDLAKSFGKPVLVHTCGSSSWAYEDFIEMGVDAVETLQPEAEGMAPAQLKARFGGRLCFHGCISTAGPLAYGTPMEVDTTVKRTLEVMMPSGGYILAPTHQIQDNTPPENIIAMYRAAHTYGIY